MKRFLLLIALIISVMGLCAQNVGDNVSIDYVRYVLKFTVTSIEPAECEVVCTSKAASAPIVVKIPSTVTIGETEYNVTSLGYEAFRQKSISGVELPEEILGWKLVQKEEENLKKELFFKGGGEAYFYFKRIGIVKD